MAENNDNLKNEDVVQESVQEKPLGVHPTLPHYYGDIIRKLFLAAGIILLITLPFLRDRISLSGFSAVLFIIILTFLAGITNPLKKWVGVGNNIISVLGFALFSYSAIVQFDHIFDLLFITNLSLAAIFLFTFYLSIKTSRGSDIYIPKAEKQKALEKSEDVEHPNLPRANLVKVVPNLKKEGSEDVLTNSKLSQPLTEEERRKERFLHPENLQ